MKRRNFLKNVNRTDGVVITTIRHRYTLREVWGSAYGPFKLNTLLPTARHRCNVSSEVETVLACHIAA